MNISKLSLSWFYLLVFKYTHAFQRFEFSFKRISFAVSHKFERELMKIHGEADGISSQ